MDTSEVVILGEVHVRESQTKSKSKPQEIQESNDEDIVFLGQEGTVYKTKSIKKKINFLEQQVQSDSDRNLQYIGFGNNGVINPGVPSRYLLPPPLIPPIPSTLIPSATRIHVKGICMSSSNARKNAMKYLSSYFGSFGAVKSVCFDTQGAIISFENPAAADLSLQQNHHTICENVCEVKRAKATKCEKRQMRKAIQKAVAASQGQLGQSTATARTALNLSTDDPPYTSLTITPNSTQHLSATRINVKGICMSWSTERIHVEERIYAKEYLRSYFGVFGAVKNVHADPHHATIKFENPAAADLSLQQNLHTICGNILEVKRAKASKREKKQMEATLDKNVPAPQARPGPSTATARTTINISPLCAAPNESNSGVVCPSESKETLSCLLNGVRICK